MRDVPVRGMGSKVLMDLLRTQVPRLVEGEEVRGFLLSPEQYEAVLQLLEDIADLDDGVKAEAEYEAGQSRPFADYHAARKSRA